MNDLQRRIAALSPEQREQLRKRLQEKAASRPEAVLEAIERHDGRSDYPASSAQERMWFLQKVAPESTDYAGSTAWRLEGPLNIDALKWACEQLVARHEILRTNLEERAGTLVQVPSRTGSQTVEIVDLTALETEAREAAVRRFCLDPQERRFDLAKDPMIRFALFRLAADEHVLVASAHHAVSDGLSLKVLTRDLSALYAARASERASEALAPLPLQYGDYAIWERARLAGPALAASVAYWTEQLRDVPELEMPGYRRGASAGHEPAGVQRVAIPAVLMERLKTLAVEQRATVFTVLAAALDVLFHRLSGQTDLAFGTPVANRPRREFEPLIGLFSNLVVVRVRGVRPSMRFVELLRSVRDGTLQAFEHQEVPFDRIVQELRPNRSAADTNPLVRTALTVQTSEQTLPSFAGVSASSFRIDDQQTRFDLEWHVHEGETAEVEAFYRVDAFDDSTIVRLLQMYVAVLQAVATEPGRTLSSVPLLDERERVRLLVDGKGKVAPYPQLSLGALFQDRVAQYPASIAVEDERTRWTYAELEARALRLAGVLQGAGAGPNVPVAVWLERGAPLVSALVGISCAGAAYVPLDVTQPALRAATVLRDTGATIVVSSEALKSSVPEGPWTVITLEAAEQAPDRPVTNRSVADDLAYVMYTSGSTGRPKGVAVPQRAVVHLVIATDYVEFGPQTVMAQIATPAFDAATFEIWGALLTGGRLVVVPTAVAISGTALQAYIQRTGVTTAFLTASLAHQIARECPSALSSFDTLVIGGEALEPRWIAEIQKAGGPRRIVNGYGPTETTTFAIWYEVPPVSADTPTIPIGWPLARVEAYVLDKAGELVPAGVVGELHIGGEGLSVGYFGAPRLTAGAFVPDHVSGGIGRRLYRTGDLVRWTPDGTLEFLGRRDGQLKLRGFRIELGEIEAALASDDKIGAAVVLVRGTGSDRRLVAYVAPRGEAELDAVEIRDGLKQRLPPYMVPAAIVVLPTLPLNVNGKIDRAALPDPVAAVAEKIDTPPRAEDLERQITAVWARVLGIPNPHRRDNFFDLGGHSLLLVRVQAELKQATGLSVPVVTLFEHPTVEGLARQLGGTVSEAAREEHAVVPAGDGAAIAIVGMAGRFPEAADVDSFWNNLRNGRESIRRFTSEELAAAGVPQALRENPYYVPARGALDAVDQFDAELFAFTPREAALLDPQQRLLLECAWTALEDAGYAPRHAGGSRVGVYVGASEDSYASQLQAHANAAGTPEAYERLLANGRDFLATRLSYKLQLTGPAVTVQTACSTSLVAVHQACQSLIAGECDLAIAGGVSVTVPTVGGYLFQPDGIASRDGHCRPFDASASGTLGGNGVGIVVLKPLSAALRDGDAIRAVIRGSAINNDGADKVGFTAPSVAGQAAVIRSALAAANVAPESIGYVEAHGTGTALGDPIEVTALRQALGDGQWDTRCALGSVKSNIGHLDAAAGVAALIKTILALQHRELPPTLHFRTPNPQIDFGQLYVPTKAEPWLAADGAPRRAGVSSFGMGGTNVHVVIEEAPPLERRPAPPSEWHILPVSAHSSEALEEAAETLSRHLQLNPDQPLPDVTYTMQVGRPALIYRRAAIGRTVGEVATSLRATRAVLSTTRVVPQIWVFPGQGAQRVNMGRALYESSAVFREEIDACASLLETLLGADLRRVLYPTVDDEESAIARFQETTWAQAALVSVELAMAAYWRARGLSPDAVIGHSVGELAAACIAGVISRDSALRLAVTRGRLMAETPPGAMLAVAADARKIGSALGDDLWLAAINSPTQCVVSGTERRIDDFAIQLATLGITTQRLRTAGAFHSGLMNGVVGALTQFASTLPHGKPQVPWFSSVNATAFGDAATVDPSYWALQVTAPVRWHDAVTAARSRFPNAAWLEVGPGRTLGRLLAPVNDELVVASLDGDDESRSAAAALAALWSAGISPTWPAVYEGIQPRRVRLPTYPFQRRRYWIEAASTAVDSTVAAPRAISKRDDVSTWCYAPGFMRVPLEDAAASEHVRVLAFVDGTAVLDHACDQLESAGAVVTRVRLASNYARVAAREYRVNPAVHAHYDALLRDVGEAGAPTHLLHGWSLSSGEQEDAIGRISTARLFGPVSLTLALQSLERAGTTSLNLLVVTSDAQDVIGDEVVRAEAAMLGGLCRVIPQEYPHIRCRTIDLTASLVAAADEHTIRHLVHELISTVDDAVVAVRNGHRWVERIVPRRLGAPAGRPALVREGGVYVITGGLGRVGLAVAQVLAQVRGVRLMFVGRSAFPSRHQWDAWVSAHTGEDPIARTITTLRGIESQGAEVDTWSADVSDLASMRAMLDAVAQRWHRIDGVVHAAGLRSGWTFAPIANLSTDAFVEQGRAKAEGARVLAELLDGRRLDFCVLMSSLSTALGGLGFGAYASANAFLDAVASAESRRSGVPWISVAWDGWAFPEDGLAQGAAERLAMRPEEGQEVFRRLLDSTPAARVIVSTADLDERAARTRVTLDSRAPATPHHRPEDKPYVAPRTDLERTLAGIWQELIGLERVSIHDDFFDLGGHSLLGTQMLSRVRDRIRGPVALADLFAAPTVAELASRIEMKSPSAELPAEKGMPG